MLSKLSSALGIRKESYSLDFQGMGISRQKHQKLGTPKTCTCLLVCFFHSFPGWNLGGMITPLILRHHVWHTVMQYFRMEGNLRHPNFRLFNLAFSLGEKKSCLTFEPHDIPLPLLPLHWQHCLFHSLDVQVIVWITQYLCAKFIFLIFSQTGTESCVFQSS